MSINFKEETNINSINNLQKEKIQEKNKKPEKDYLFDKILTIIIIICIIIIANLKYNLKNAKKKIKVYKKKIKVQKKAYNILKNNLSNTSEPVQEDIIQNNISNSQNNITDITDIDNNVTNVGNNETNILNKSTIIKNNKNKKIIKKKCNVGYFNPIDSKENNCIKCSVKNCYKCTNTIKDNICLICKPSYFPKYDKKRKKIISCNSILNVYKIY